MEPNGSHCNGIISGDVRIVSHGLRRRRYRAWVLLAFLHDLLGDVRIVSHGLPLCATPFLPFNNHTRPVNKQHFHGSLHLLPLRVYTGLTRNHRHDSEGRGGRGREEDLPHCRRSPYTGFSVSDARTTVTRNTGVPSRGGFRTRRNRQQLGYSVRVSQCKDTHKQPRRPDKKTRVISVTPATTPCLHRTDTQPRSSQ